MSAATWPRRRMLTEVERDLIARGKLCAARCRDAARQRAMVTGDSYAKRLLVAELASITDALARFATNVVDAMGLGGVFVLMLLESACIPIPSEATMLFTGFNVSAGHYSLFAAVAVGTLGNLVGSWVAYWIGYAGRVDLLEKHGKKLHIKKSHLEWADRWFERHGDATVFFARMLPIIRTFISLPAGVARMPFWRFTIFTLAGV